MFNFDCFAFFTNPLNSLRSAQPRWVVFDWDRTLSVLEMGEFDISSNNKKVIVKRVFGSAERFTNLLDMLNSLKEANVKLAILSFNSSHLIKKCLRIVMHDAELFTHPRLRF